jgi:hypothetical protein
VAAIISFVLSQASACRALLRRNFHEGSLWRAVFGWEQMRRIEWKSASGAADDAMRLRQSSIERFAIQAQEASRL